MTFEFFSATDTGRARSNNEDSVAIDDGRRPGRAGRRHGRLQRRRSRQRHGHLVHLDRTRPLAAPRRRRKPPTARSAARWTSASTTPTAPSSTPPTPTRSTPAWARRWWWASSATSRVLMGHVGDSRAYRLRGGRLQQITRDHSLLQEQIDAGLITPEQAAFSANKNLVTRAVGVEDTVLLEPQHDVHARRHLPAVLRRPVGHARRRRASRRCCRRTTRSTAAASALIDAANDAGGKG